MIQDKTYCASSFLMYRTIADRRMAFPGTNGLRWTDEPSSKAGVHTSRELLETLEGITRERTAGKKCAIALSGGIDSAALLKFMPEGSIAYTFRCEVPGVETEDESVQAAAYIEAAGVPGIKHKVIPVLWEDMEGLSVPLMVHKGAPIHSIEVQIYKAALQAKADGCEVFVFGEDADCAYGGHSKLLSRDWTFGEFVERYTYVQPYHALKDYVMDLLPYRVCTMNGYVDVHAFIKSLYSHEAFNSYTNPCDLAGIELCAPYIETEMSVPLDLGRVRAGENKYLIREMFAELYPGLSIPPKNPMPRPMGLWLEGWEGPVRPEFWSHCTDSMTGDQKWLVWSLERYLDILEKA